MELVADTVLVTVDNNGGVHTARCGRNGYGLRCGDEGVIGFDCEALHRCSRRLRLVLSKGVEDEADAHHDADGRRDLFVKGVGEPHAQEDEAHAGSAQ